MVVILLLAILAAILICGAILLLSLRITERKSNAELARRKDDSSFYESEIGMSSGGEHP